MSRPIHLLLLSLGLLLVGHGMQLSLLPLFGRELGWSDMTIGLTGAAYFIGFVVGCIKVPSMLNRAGHIRVFLCMAATTAGVLILLQSLTSPLMWIVLRFITGFSLAAIYATTESWLNEHSNNTNRGKVMSTYVIVTLIGIAIGQQLLGLVASDMLFSIAAAIMLLALWPLGLYSQDQPMHLKAPKLAFNLITQLPLIASAGCFLSGIVTGSIWTMAPLVGESRGFGLLEIGFLMNAVVLGGAICQLPVGMASDWLGRTRLILLTAATNLVLAVLLVFPYLPDPVFFAAMFLYGGTSLTLYAVCAAEANDRSPLSRVQLAAMLLLLNGAGSALGPLLTGLLASVSPAAMFISAAFSMTLLLTVPLFQRSLPSADILSFPTPPSHSELDRAA